MNASPLLHSGQLNWDEYLLLILGILILMALGAVKQKADQNESEDAEVPPEHKV